METGHNEGDEKRVKKRLTQMLAWILCVSLLLGMPVLAVGAEDASKDIPTSGIQVTAGNSHSGYGPELVLDGQEGTKWETSWSGSDRSSHWLVFDLGGSHPVDGLRYQPRQDNQLNGTITKYEIWGSDNGTNFVKVHEGEWAANHDWKSANFGPYNMTHLKLVVVDAEGDSGNSSL